MTRVTERDLLDRLHARYANQNGIARCVIAEHVRNNASFDATRTCDALMVDTWRSTLAIHGFEVKCSRQDWLNELKTPAKAEAFIPFCDYWWLIAASKDIVRDDLPDGWGLLVPHGDTTLRVEKQARKRHNRESMPLQMIAPMLRSVQRTAESKGYEQGRLVGLGADAGQITKLEADLDKLAVRNKRLMADTGRAQRERDYYKKALAVVSPEGLPCTTCGKGLRPKSYRYGDWKHRRKKDEQACEQMRKDRARVKAQADWDDLTPAEQEKLLHDFTWRDVAPTPAEMVDRWCRYPGPPEPVDLERLDDEQEEVA